MLRTRPDDGGADVEDWRGFRAKLVMSEGPSPASPSADAEDSDNADLDGIGSLFSASAPAPLTPLDPSQWAYDAGDVIEKGAVILGGVEQDFGFGLRQQYFHKAVILVLDHDENTFTKGIILNRPSGRTVEDEINEGLTWRVWYGGDVQGLDSLAPDIVCLHSLRSEEAREASVAVMKDIQWTSFENAKKLVKKGVAAGPQDFWLFAGYAGWGPRQLAGELDRKSWYMCATDSGTLLKELARQGPGIDPRDAGLATWHLLMDMIGRGDASGGSFDDLMLKEWSAAHLLRPADGGATTTVDQLMRGMARRALASPGDVAAGRLLRASSAERSPFLLQKQELHRAVVLVILEDDAVSLGCMLNRPATKAYQIEMVGASTTGTPASIPIRYGGDYAIKGQSSLMWLHCNPRLRDAGLGSPVGDQGNGFYTCSQEDAVESISHKLAKPEDFLILSGVCAWPKLVGGLASEVTRGAFEVVEESRVAEVFRSLQNQETLTEDNLAANVATANEAWREAGSGAPPPVNRGAEESLTVGIGEGFDENDDTLVFHSDKKVAQLADEALTKWVATFLLGSPTLV